jgi:hypothetical protein
LAASSQQQIADIKRELERREEELRAREEVFMHTFVNVHVEINPRDACQILSLTLPS